MCFYGSYWSQISLKKLRWDELVPARKRLDIILFLHTGMPQNPQFCNVIQILFVLSYINNNMDCYALILKICHNFILSCVDHTGSYVDSWDSVPGHRWGFWDLFLELGWIWVDIWWAVSSSGFSQIFKNP